MANKLISEMGLPKSTSHVFAARNIITAKDALSLSEFELMELLDVGLEEVARAVAHISEYSCPPYETALSLLERRIQNENLAGHLPTRLEGLDAALCGGIPFGVVTELVGPSGIGKTQFCMKLALLASLPTSYGGLGGRVIYIDVESKFSSKRMIEMGLNSFPDIFHKEGLAQEMAGRILVLRPTSLSEFTERRASRIFLGIVVDRVLVLSCLRQEKWAEKVKVIYISQKEDDKENRVVVVTGAFYSMNIMFSSLQQIKLSLLQNDVKLLIVDSMAALASGYDQGPPRQHPLGWHISFIKSLAEFCRIPVVVTNQVRSQVRNDASGYSFQDHCRAETLEDPTTLNSHLVAALGIHWAHAVTIRLVLESKSGCRFIKLAKSSISPSIGFLFNITSSGISLLDDKGVEMTGPEVNTIHCQASSTMFCVLGGSVGSGFAAGMLAVSVFLIQACRN